MKTKDIFINNSSIADSFIQQYEYPYLILPDIKDYIIKSGNSLSNEYECKGQDIWVHKKAIISDKAEIYGPCIIDEGAVIKPFAFIAGSVIIGKNCMIGSSCEIKNAIIYDDVQIAHLNYVGDSIIGFHAHLGAGSIISNLRLDKKDIVMNRVNTKMVKIGAFVGDFVEVGCNVVLNPGTVIGHHSVIYPTVSVQGEIKEYKIIKDKNIVVSNNDLKGEFL